MSVCLQVKPQGAAWDGAAKFSITVELEGTVADLKEQVARQLNAPADSIRLVCSGKILAIDESKLSYYGVKDGASLYCMKNLVKKALPAACQVLQQVDPMRQIIPERLPEDASFIDRLAHKTLQENPDMVRSMTEQLLEGGIQVLHEILDSDPKMQELLDKNPEMAKMLQDPEMFEKARKIILSPSFAAEHRRQQDLAMSNLSVAEGGEEILRQALEPMQEAVQRFVERSAATSSSSCGPASASDQPLSNPWASSGASSSSAAPADASVDAAASMELVSKMMGDKQFQESKGMQDFVAGCLENQDATLKEAERLEAQGVPIQEMAQQKIQEDGMMERSFEMWLQMRRSQGHNDSPEFMQFMRNKMEASKGNPAMMQTTQTAATSAPAQVQPNMAQMMSQNPMQAMQNPQVQQLMQQRAQDPQMQQQMQAQMQRIQALQARMGQHGQGATPQANPMASMFQNMMQMQGQNPSLGGAQVPMAVPAPAESIDPSLYTEQIEELKSMGFEDKPAVMRALAKTSGDIASAIDMLTNDEPGTPAPIVSPMVPPAPMAVTPEVRLAARRMIFGAQLQQLVAMGFTDEELCLRALAHSNGQVDEAIAFVVASSGN